MSISHQVSLKTYNTFGIDVTAEAFAAFNSVDTLRKLMLEETKLPRLILGGGSNILFTGNFPGIVMRNEIKGIEVMDETPAHYFVKASAGEVWHSFVLYCIENNFAGIENLSLIPGSVGAAPMQNIGAYGVEIKDVFHSLEAVNVKTLESKNFTAAECKFGYRESVFKHELKNQFVITAVTFRLNKNPVYHTSYGSIAQELEKMKVNELSIRAVSNAVIAIRSAKLPDPAKIGNAGSFFKNPEVSAEVFGLIKSAFPDLVAYPLENGNYKLAAGWLIEKAGWKGHTRVNYGVHKLQALVLVNYGGASGQDIYNLSGEIMHSIEEKFGVKLEREVNIV